MQITTKNMLTHRRAADCKCQKVCERSDRDGNSRSSENKSEFTFTVKRDPDQVNQKNVNVKAYQNLASKHKGFITGTIRITRPPPIRVKIRLGGLILGLSPFPLLLQQPQKMMLALKVVLKVSKIIILIHQSQSATHSVVINLL